MNTNKPVSFTVNPGGAITGDLTVPGDKSISHRALMLGAIADGETSIQGFLQGEDTLATAKAFRDMGVEIRNDGAQVNVKGVGLHGLQAPRDSLDLGNSGTSVRLLTGLLSGQSFNSELIGDESLMKRPMRRIIDPLTSMNADVKCTDDGTMPINIKGGRSLTGIEYTLPVASAQLKSCLLLAGLYAEGTTTIIENKPTRDHTERMLAAFSCPVKKSNTRITINNVDKLIGTDISVPADFSSAAFFIVAASLAPGSDVVLKNVGVNSTRSAMLDILGLMGADIELENKQEKSGEPVADIHVKTSQLQGIDIPEKMVPVAIDEFPAILIAAANARGITRLRGATELRVKESDRIQSMLEGFIATGINAEASEEGMTINGGEFKGGVVNSQGDHRIAMAFAVAGFISRQPITITHCENVATSFPGFVELAQQAGMDISYV